MSLILVVQKYTLGSKIILGILFAILLSILLRYAFKLIEMAYVLKIRRPLYNHLYFHLRRLSKDQKGILENKFSFYSKLSSKEKKYFEHRVASFIIDKDFIGRNGLVVTDEIKVLISATAVMLTFGFRDFYVPILSKIVIYPSNFYSRINKAYHKGEFNPKLQTLVISWEGFLQGFDDENDNLNLGIHELTHAIHFNSIKERDVSSVIFSDTLKELSALLSTDSSLRDRLKTSDYFRKYAFTNQFEFLAVVIENFIETPLEFRSQFPHIYNKVKQMLNFRIKGY